MTAGRRRKTRQTSEEMWASIFEEWRKSDLSPEEFCTKEKYSIYGFNHYYEKQFGKSPIQKPDRHSVEERPMFVPLKVTQAREELLNPHCIDRDNCSKIEICVGSRPIVIRVQAGFDPLILKQVVDTLGGS